jgi:hypothetical protein
MIVALPATLVVLAFLGIVGFFGYLLDRSG